MANNNRFSSQYTVLSPEGSTISVYQPDYQTQGWLNVYWLGNLLLFVLSTVLSLVSFDLKPVWVKGGNSSK